MSIDGEADCKKTNLSFLLLDVVYVQQYANKKIVIFNQDLLSIHQIFDVKIGFLFIILISYLFPPFDTVLIVRGNDGLIWRPQWPGRPSEFQPFIGAFIFSLSGRFVATHALIEHCR